MVARKACTRRGGRRRRRRRRGMRGDKAKEELMVVLPVLLCVDVFVLEDKGKTEIHICLDAPAR